MNKDEIYSIYVSNINPSTKHTDLFDAFADFQPQSAYIKKSNKSTYYGFVNFNSEENREKALKTLQKKELDGNFLNLKRKAEKECDGIKKVNDKEDISVYVNKLGKGTTEELLFKYFKPFNPKKASVYGSYGFVSFYNEKDRNSALINNGQVFGSNVIEVNIKRNHRKNGGAQTSLKKSNCFKEIKRWEISTTLSKYITYGSREELYEIERQFPVCSLVLHYPDSTEKPYHENQFKVEGISPLISGDQINKYFGSITYEEHEKKLIFKSKKEAESAYNKFNGEQDMKICETGKRITLSHVEKQPQLILRVIRDYL